MLNATVVFLSSSSVHIQFPASSPPIQSFEIPEESSPQILRKESLVFNRLPARILQCLCMLCVCIQISLDLINESSQPIHSWNTISNRSKPLYNSLVVNEMVIYPCTGYNYLFDPFHSIVYLTSR